jgi:hypothetical protein
MAQDVHDSLHQPRVYQGGMRREIKPSAAWFLLLQPRGGREAPARRPGLRVGRSHGRLPLREGYSCHTPPSHTIRPHRGPLPSAVGAGILPLEPADVLLIDTPGVGRGESDRFLHPPGLGGCAKRRVGV